MAAGENNSWWSKRLRLVSGNNNRQLRQESCKKKIGAGASVEFKSASEYSVQQGIMRQYKKTA